MTGSKVAPASKSAERMRAQVRDTVVTAVARVTEVPVADIMRARGRRTQRASEARWIAMWVLSQNVDAVGVPELVDLFSTTERTIDHAWWEVAHTPRLIEIARLLIQAHRPALDALPVVRDGEGD